MTNGLKSLQSLEAEEQAMLAELTGIENALLELHDREQSVRNELAHIENQKQRVAACQQ